MKTLVMLVSVGIMLAMSPGTFGQTAYTDPVGVFKLNVPAGTVETPSLESFSIPVHRIPVDRGRATGIGAGIVTNEGVVCTWTDTGKAWVPDEFVYAGDGDERYYVEIADGTAAGRKYEIVSNTADTLTLIVMAGEQEPLDAGAAAGDAYLIVPFYRIRDVFGEPTEPEDVKLFGGSNDAAADNILLWNGTGFDTIYYSTFFGENKWRKSGIGICNDDPIWPGEGFFIRRRATTAVTISIGGAVPVTQRVTPVQGGNLTFVGIEFPASVPLDESEILTLDGGPLTGGSNPGAADLIYAWNGAAYDTYYFSTFFGENQWRLAGGDISGDTPLEAGRGYFIRERDETEVLDWFRTLPYPLP